MSPASDTRRSESKLCLCTSTPIKNLLVDTGLRSENAQQRADEARAAQVATALAECRYLAPHNVAIQIIGPSVRLTGQVGSYYEKQLATAAVQSVGGVEQLENELNVCR